MKNVLLLGGGGFIGKSIAEKLSSLGGYKVTVADNFFRNSGKLPQRLDFLQREKGVRVISDDFTAAKAFESIGGNYDQVYMLASVVGVDYVNSIPHEIIRINTQLIMNTLEWLRHANCKRVLFTSTSECYAGSVEKFGYMIPTPEEVPLCIDDISHPRFTYAVTKMLGESGFINYGRSLDFESLIVRYHNVYGPEMGFKHVIPHLAQRFMANENPFRIFGHDQTRSFNYIDDAVNGTILTMEQGKPYEIYHIGDMDEISIEELVRFAGTFFNYKGDYIYEPTYPGSVSRRCPEIGKARKELGYSPAIHWKDGITRTLQWYQDYLKSNPKLSESFYDNKKA